RRWLATHPAADGEILAEHQRQQYARNLERLHLQDIIARAVDALDRAPPARATTVRPEGGPITRILRDQSVDTGLLRTYLRAVTALGRLNERPPIAAPPPPPALQPWMQAKIAERVEAWQAEYGVPPRFLQTLAENITADLLSHLELQAQHQRLTAADD